MTEPTEAIGTVTDEDEPGDGAATDATCDHCGDRFPSERLRDLHRGLKHYPDLDDDERDAYETAYEAETEDLRSFRLRALAVLVLLYFGFLMTYAVVTL